MATLSVERFVAVRVEPRGAVVAATTGANLLEVLRSEGIPVSFSCQAGRCGTCRCELLSGEVNEDPNCEFRGSGVAGGPRHVLACRTQLIGDCVIGLVEPDEVITHPAQALKCRVESVSWLSASTLVLKLMPNRRLRFSAGQYARLDFGVGMTRPYSMANAEHEDVLEFHLRCIDSGRVTGYVAERVRAGDVVKLIGPLGTSYLRRKHLGPVLCVAGGTGLAPILSIVRTAVTEGVGGVIRVYVGARSQADLYGIAELKGIERQHPSRLIIETATDTQPLDPSLRHGLVTDLVAADLSSLAQWKIYLAGPPAMVEAGTQLAMRLGALPRDIHADAFYPAERQ